MDSHIIQQTENIHDCELLHSSHVSKPASTSKHIILSCQYITYTLQTTPCWGRFQRSEMFFLSLGFSKAFTKLQNNHCLPHKYSPLQFLLKQVSLIARIFTSPLLVPWSVAFRVTCIGVSFSLEIHHLKIVLIFSFWGLCLGDVLFCSSPSQSPYMVFFQRADLEIKLKETEIGNLWVVTEQLEVFCLFGSVAVTQSKPLSSSK